MSIYGRQGELETIGGRLICHVCGRDYLSLQSHAWAAHGYAADQYREEFGLYPTTPLWAENISAKLTASNIRRMRADPKALLTMSKRALQVERATPSVHPAVRARIGQSLSRKWATMPKEARMAKAKELAALSPAKEWWDAHPDAKARRAERARRLGQGHKWGVSGEKNPQAKLTPTDVQDIRARFEQGERRTDIANRYGVSAGLVWLIVRRKIWKQVA